MRVLVNILIRQAKLNNPEEPKTWLEELQTAKFASASAQNGQITGTSVNGKSVTVQAMPGCSLADLLTASELAINCLDAGWGRMPSRTRGVLG